MRWLRWLAIAFLMVPAASQAADVLPPKISGTEGGYAIYHWCIAQTLQAFCTDASLNTFVIDLGARGWNKAVVLYLDATNSTATTWSCILKSSASGSGSTLVSTLGVAITNTATAETIIPGLPTKLWIDCTAAAIVGGSVDMRVTVAPYTPGGQ